MSKGWSGWMVLAAIGTVLMATPASGGHTQGVTKDGIKIGFYGPLTGPGYLWGKLTMNGAEVVFNEVNRAGGIHGRKITTVREDDRCDVAAGVAAMKKLVHQHKVFLVHGGGCSNPTIAARDEVEKAGVPFINFLAVADKIVLPRAPYIWTTTVQARIESTLQAEFTASNPAFKRVAIVSQHDAWGRSRYEPLMERLKKLGLTPVADEEITVDTNDATAQVLKVQRANADALILVAYPKPGAVIMRDMYKLGVRVPVIGQRAIADLIEFDKQVGIPGAIEHFYTISETSITPEDPRAAKWAELLKRDFPEDRISIYTLSGIASAQVLVEALRRTGSDLTVESFKATMDRLCGRFTDLYVGDICFTPEDPQGNKSAAWLKLDRGKVVNVGSKFPAK